MSTNLIPIKSFLGKYYSEILYSATQDKYKNTGLDTFFEQRFIIQDNKIQMIVDPGLTGLIMNVTGNEIHISKNLYDHPNVIISNSLENPQTINQSSLYNPAIFSTLAYLICQNHITLQIVGEVDEPIYILYKSCYETFYNSIVIFDIAENIEVEIIEEIESCSALNFVTDYKLNFNSSLNLTTFYKNHISALSFCYRNVISYNNSHFNHILLGKGCSNIIDENKIYVSDKSNVELLGIINAKNQNFHSILYVEPRAQDYKISVVYKDILSKKANVTFFPVIVGNIISDSATIEVSNIDLDEIPIEKIESDIQQFISDIVQRSILKRTIGVERFYNNKSKFLQFN